MGLGHKLKKAFKHGGRQGLYAGEYYFMDDSELHTVSRELRTDSSLSDKERRERLRAVSEAKILKHFIK